MNSFAIYRLPHAEQCTLIRQTSGTPRQLAALSELNDSSGFVVAPFSISRDRPLLLIRPDEVLTLPCQRGSLLVANYEFPAGKLPVSRRETPSVPAGRSEGRAAYASDFARFHQKLSEGAFRKVVLSRCAVEPRTDDEAPLDLFLKACERYPRLFVAMVYTPQSGLWLVATPEILLEGSADSWRTIALAGTMQLQGDDLKGEGEHARWSAKNIEEQRLVATYIMEQLKPFVGDLCEEGPRTVRAANLVHLRSDFTFTLLNNARVGDLLSALHPTPAVCGLPKSATLRFILDNEHSPRRYYSGFMGPLNLQPSPSSSLSAPATHLYVSLRCMQMTDSAYCLYAGGGLLKESQEEQEWQETEAKLQTMRQLINHCAVQS